MKTLRERIHQILNTISTPVEKTAYDELPTHAIVVSGAVAGLLATLSLLAVAHLGDVLVLRHYYAFLIGYVFTVFSSVPLIIMHTLIGAVAAYVHLRAEEYLGSGQWLALACFLPLFTSTGSYVADRLVEATSLSMSAAAPTLRVLLTILATLAMTWLFWVPWLSFYRIWLKRRTLRQQLAQQLDSEKAPEDEVHSDPMESSRSYIRVRREIALMRKHRSGDLDASKLSSLDGLLTPVGRHVSEDGETFERSRQVRASGWRSITRRVAVVSVIVLAILVVAGLSFNGFLPNALRGVMGQKGDSIGDQTVRIWVKAADVSPSLMSELATEALSQSGIEATADVVDIQRFSIFAVRTIMYEGMADIVIGSRQDIRAMADMGMLMDMTPFLQRDQLDLGEYADSCVEELTIDGRVFGLPLSTSPLLLYINTGALSYTDLSPHTPPVLWSDLLEYSKALTWFTNPSGIHTVSRLGFMPTDDLWRIFLLMAMAYTPGDEWRTLVDLASSLRATSLPDPPADHRNPFYERPYDPEALFASDLLGMVIADYRLHSVLERSFPDLEYAVADIPVPEWGLSGVAFSNGLALGVFGSGSDTPGDVTPSAEASWHIAKTIATEPIMQTRIADNSGLLPPLESLLDQSISINPSPRGLSQGDDAITSKFCSAQLLASPATITSLPASSLTRIYSLLNRLVQGAETVPYVLEQIASASATRSDE